MDFRGFGDTNPSSVGEARRPPARILVVEEDAAARRRVAEALRELGHAVAEAGDGLDAIGQFTQLRPQIALLDATTPTLDGFAVCRAIRDLPGGSEASIVLVTEVEDGDSVQRGYDAGATDFVTKPINLRLLQQRIRFMVQAGELSDRLRRSERRIEKLAYLNPLTGLPNRRSLERYITHLLRAPGRQGPRGAIFLVDLDGFKRVNDTYGHAVGDELIGHVGRRVGEQVGLRRDPRASGAMLAHLGGDDFVYVDPTIVEAAEAERLATELLAALGTSFPLRGHQIAVSATIGISLIDESDETVDDVIQRADAAMYDAKAHDRNNVRFYDRGLRARAKLFLDTQNDLRQAIARRELELHYQPKIHLASGALAGVEALLRWRHPDRGFVSPAEFIPIAEESHLIVDIGRWVLHEAFRQVERWQRDDELLQDLRVAINVSARQLRDRGFLEETKTLLRQTGIRPSLIEIELTERTLMDDAVLGGQILTELDALGIHTSIDDFGTGYSSLGYLRLFPIDTLKIDRTFVRDVPHDKGSAAITGAIITMAKQLGLGVVAEGVETAEQLEWLERIGCDEVQGYYFSRALDARELPEWGRLRAEQRRLRPTVRPLKVA